jgi:hypothetical protein
MKLSLQKISRLACLVLCAGVGPANSAAGTATAQIALPAWQSMEFEQQAFFTTARSRIEITRNPHDEQQWLLTANSSVASNTEQVQLTFAAENGRAISRSRLSRGKNQRVKSYQYLPDSIQRERREPGTNPQQPAAEWTVSNRQKIPYPQLPQGTVITDAYALLLLAERFQAGPGQSSDVVAQTDFNFYHVHMTRGDALAIAADYQITGADSVAGKHNTRTVILQVEPLGALAEKPDFSLLGLYGTITLLFDDESGQLLQLRGNAPKLGPAEINLKTVTPREPQP